MASIVLVIDAQGVFRRGFRHLIERSVSDCRVLEASTLDGVDDRAILDLVLVDTGSFAPPQLDRLRDLAEENPQARFALLSSSNTRSAVLECLSAGFHGFIYKLQSDPELIEAVNDLLSGRIFAPRWLADADKSGGAKGTFESAPVHTPSFTPRQTEILPLLAAGMSNNAIASRLRISLGTTQFHIAALRKALGARNRAEAAGMAGGVARPKSACTGAVKATNNLSDQKDAALSSAEPLWLAGGRSMRARPALKRSAVK